jgi:hypothetical protein
MWLIVNGQPFQGTWGDALIQLKPGDSMRVPLLTGGNRATLIYWQKKLGITLKTRVIRPDQIETRIWRYF